MRSENRFRFFSTVKRPEKEKKVHGVLEWAMVEDTRLKRCSEWFASLLFEQSRVRADTNWSHKPAVFHPRMLLSWCSSKVYGLTAGTYFFHGVSVSKIVSERKKGGGWEEHQHLSKSLSKHYTNPPRHGTAQVFLLVMNGVIRSKHPLVDYMERELWFQHTRGSCCAWTKIQVRGRVWRNRRKNCIFYLSVLCHTLTHICPSTDKTLCSALL